MKNLVYIRNITTLQLNPKKCTGCKMCMIVCPHAVFKFIDKKAIIVNKDNCMECGACSVNCPKKAIIVRSGVGCAAGIIQGSINQKKSIFKI